MEEAQAVFTPIITNIPDGLPGEEIHIIKRIWKGCKFALELPKPFIENFDKFKFDDGSGRFVPIKNQSASRSTWTNDDAFCQLLIDIHQKIYGDPSSDPDETNRRLIWIGENILPLLYTSGLQQTFGDRSWGGEFSIEMAPPSTGENPHLVIVKRLDRGSHYSGQVETSRDVEAIYDLNYPFYPPLITVNDHSIDWRIDKFRKPLETFLKILNRKFHKLHSPQDGKLLKLIDDLKLASEEKIEGKTSYVTFQEKHWTPFIRNLRDLCHHQQELSAEGKIALQGLVQELYRNQTQKDLALMLMPQLFKDSNISAYSPVTDQSLSLAKDHSWRSNYFFQFFNHFLGALKGIFNPLFDPLGSGSQLPYLHSNYTFAGKNTSCLQMGSPVVTKTRNKPEIGDEFSLFIDGLAPQERHLCINTQKRFLDEAPSSLLSPWKRVGKKIARIAEKHFGFGLEKERTRALENYVDSRKDGKLVVVTLANDGPLYNQDGEGWEKKGMTYDDFKDRFVKTFVTHPSYSIPINLQDSLKQDAVDILDFLYATLFQGKEEVILEPLTQQEGAFFTPSSRPALTREQRKDLIEHFNALLTFKILERTGATSFNITGEKNTGLNTYWRLIFQKKSQDPQERAQFSYLLNAPTFLSKTARTLPLHSDRFDSAMDHLTPAAISKMSTHPTFQSFSRLFK
jgi:hypothetical protein